MEPKYQLIVRNKTGVVIRDTPRPQSEGGVARRTVPVGTTLMCYTILNVGGVDYAQLVPQNPLKPEWVRVAESDKSVIYVDVYPLEEESTNDSIAKALNRIADAIEKLKA